MNPAPASSSLLYFTERGSGPALLLVHGLMVTGEMYEPLIEELSARHRVIVPDLRGHGRSRGLGPPYTVAQLASDLSHLLEYLGVGSAAVLGYSQGGAVAQQLALDHQTQCNRLILACTYAFNMATLRERFEGHLAPLVIRVIGLKRMAMLAFSLGTKDLSKERVARLIGPMASQDLDLMLAAWKEAMVFDSRLRLPEIKCPTLVVAGSSDKGVPLHHAEMLHKGIAGSQLVVIDGADHALIWTRTDEFLRVIEEFLDN